MSARELTAEARAWRRRARTVHPKWGYAIAPFPDVYGTNADMRQRAEHHEADMVASLGTWISMSPQEFYTHRVLACLFLALECEDEARALGRGGYGRSRSSA